MFDYNELLNYKPFYKKGVFDKLFTIKQLEDLLNLRPFCSNLRLHSTNPEFSTSWGQQGWISDNNTFPPSNIVDALNAGVITILDCSRITKEINQICKNLEDLTNFCTDAHLFYAHSSLQTSYTPHWDFVDNLIVMLEGSAIFKVDADIETDLREENRNNKDRCVKNIIDIELHSGDCIFIPSGFYHSVHSTNQRLSISFPMARQAEFRNVPKQDRYWIEL